MEWLLNCQPEDFRSAPKRVRTTAAATLLLPRNDGSIAHDPVAAPDRRDRFGVDSAALGVKTAGTSSASWPTGLSLRTV
jgi:hypothetical protein